jgi:excisionase family DNA binding protein
MSTQLLTVQEFAERLNVTVSCVRRWILEGRVAKVKLGRLIRIPAAECDRLIDHGFCPARDNHKNAGAEGGR